MCKNISPVHERKKLHLWLYGHWKYPQCELAKETYFIICLYFLHTFVDNGTDKLRLQAVHWFFISCKRTHTNRWMLFEGFLHLAGWRSFWAIFGSTITSGLYYTSMLQTMPTQVRTIVCTKDYSLPSPGLKSVPLALAELVGSRQTSLVRFARPPWLWQYVAASLSTVQTLMRISSWLLPSPSACQ